MWCCSEISPIQFFVKLDRLPHLDFKSIMTHKAHWPILILFVNLLLLISFQSHTHPHMTGLLMLFNNYSLNGTWIFLIYAFTLCQVLKDYIIIYKIVPEMQTLKIKHKNMVQIYGRLISLIDINYMIFLQVLIYFYLWISLSHFSKSFSIEVKGLTTAVFMYNKTLKTKVRVEDWIKVSGQNFEVLKLGLQAEISENLNFFITPSQIYIWRFSFLHCDRFCMLFQGILHLPMLVSILYSMYLWQNCNFWPFLTYDHH